MQRELVSKYWGLEALRTPEELLHILEICEIMFQQGHNWYLHNSNCGSELLDELDRAGETQKHLLLEGALVDESRDATVPQSNPTEMIQHAAVSNEQAQDLLARAINHLQSGDLPAAFSNVFEVRQFNAPFKDLELVYGLCLMQSGETSAAIQAFQKELQAHPDNQVAQQMLQDLAGS